MSWIFLDGNKFTSADTLYEMAFDGSRVWVTSSTGKIKIYSFWGDDVGLEYEIDVSGSISDTRHIIKVFDEMFVFNNATSQFLRIDITTRQITGTVNVPNVSNCIPEYGNSKIWFTTDIVGVKQALFYYDLDTLNWSSPVDLPGRDQTSKRKIKWGVEGFIFVALLNENGLAKFNDSTGAYISTITTNRLPQALDVNQNREVIVAGFNGMISSVNQTTDASTNIGGTNQVTESIADDGTYIWGTDPSCVRLTKGTSVDNFIIMLEGSTIVSETRTDVFKGFGYALQNPNVVSLTSVKEGAITLVEDVDYTFAVDNAFGEQRLTILETSPNIVGTEPLSITTDYTFTTTLADYNIVGFTNTVFQQVFITPTYTHNYWNGSLIQTRTEEQRTVLLASNAIYFGYNLSDSWDLPETRFYKLEILGTAMVGTGEEKYYGETV